jgi:hypothetical protein
MQGARSFAIALAAHAALFAAAYLTLDGRPTPPELPVEIELVDLTPPEPEKTPADPVKTPAEPEKTPAVAPTAEPEPVRIPESVPEPERVTVPATRTDVTTPAPAIAADITAATDLDPEDTPTIGPALAMRTDTDAYRPEAPLLPEADLPWSGPGRPNFNLRLQADYQPAPADEGRDPLGPLPIVKIPGDHPPPDRGELRPDGENKKKDDLTFAGVVDRYGGVEMKDKPNAHIEIALPTAKDVGDGLDRWWTTGESRPTTGWGAPGAPDSHRKDDSEIVMVWILSGGFDVTDFLTRSMGDDPYMMRKLGFLDRTRDERAGMAVTAKAEDLEESIAGLGRYLVRIWKHGDWSVAERRAILFELWDECAEPAAEAEGADGDPAGRAGEEARRIIEKFIRLRLPAGGKGAYGDDELAELNRRRQSRQRFAPYRGSSD